MKIIADANLMKKKLTTGHGSQIDTLPNETENCQAPLLSLPIFFVKASKRLVSKLYRGYPQCFEKKKNNMMQDFCTKISVL